MRAMRMTPLVTRKTFLKTTLGCAAQCFALASCPGALQAAEEAPPDPGAENAGRIVDWLSSFLAREDGNLDRTTLIKLLDERGQQCCRRQAVRQKLIAESNRDVDTLVELIGKIVGSENSTRAGNTIRLVYPMEKCGCGANPQRDPAPNDPYCECSKANNRTLFEIVSGRPVSVEVLQSPRRGGKHCEFRIQLG